VDIEEQDKDMDIPTLEYINTHKTGALIAVSCKAGALLGGGSSSQIEALYRYGKEIGLLFQIVDDILDGQGYAKVYGLEGARVRARDIHRAAVKELRIFGQKASTLRQLADFLLNRKK
jgi:geranylgeranyl diphosphate synthase type II